MIKWIKDKIIYLFFGSLALAGVIVLLNTPPLGGEITLTTTEKIDNEVEKIVEIINEDRQDNGKYKRQDKQIIDGVEYEVHEYETSKGEIGYTIFLTKEENGIVYKKGIATGAEKEDREFDWKIVGESLIASSTTK